MPRANEKEYNIRDDYARYLFLAVFRKKHRLHLYRYKGSSKLTMHCDSEPRRQERAWKEYQERLEFLDSVFKCATEEVILLMLKGE